MKKILLALSAIVLTSSIVFSASNWKTKSEDVSIDGTEIVYLENGAGSDNNWLSLSTLKTWIQTATSAFTGTTYSGTSIIAAIQAALTELDNAVEISAGTGITISNGVLSVTSNTYQPYSANLLSWAAIAPSTKQAASANLDSWAAITPNAKQDSLGSAVTSIVSAADCSTYTAAGVLCLETP